MLQPRLQRSALSVALLAGLTACAQEPLPGAAVGDPACIFICAVIRDLTAPEPVPAPAPPAPAASKPPVRHAKQPRRHHKSHRGAIVGETRPTLAPEAPAPQPPPAAVPATATDLGPPGPPLMPGSVPISTITSHFVQMPQGQP